MKRSQLALHHKLMIRMIIQQLFDVSYLFTKLRQGQIGSVLQKQIA